jgi:methanogenic corrinoid protein MtbC1
MSPSDDSLYYSGKPEEFLTQVSAIQDSTTALVVSGVVSLLVAHRYAEAEYLLYKAFDQFSHEQFLLEILMPIEIQIGELWHNNVVKVFTEHAATTFLRQQLDKLLASLPMPIDAPLVLCACGPGEIHELGILSLVYFLRSVKLNALYLGPNLPEEQIIAAIETIQPVAICLSASTSLTALKLIYILYQLSEQKRERPLVIGYGGRFFNLLPEAQRAMLPGLYLGAEAKTSSKIVLHSLAPHLEQSV